MFIIAQDLCSCLTGYNFVAIILALAKEWTTASVGACIYGLTLNQCTELSFAMGSFIGTRVWHSSLLWQALISASFNSSIIRSVNSSFLNQFLFMITSMTLRHTRLQNVPSPIARVKPHGSILPFASKILGILPLRWVASSRCIRNVRSNRFVFSDPVDAAFTLLSVFFNDETSPKLNKHSFQAANFLYVTSLSGDETIFGRVLDREERNDDSDDGETTKRQTCKYKGKKDIQVWRMGRTAHPLFRAPCSALCPVPSRWWSCCGGSCLQLHCGGGRLPHIVSQWGTPGFTKSLNMLKFNFATNFAPMISPGPAWSRANNHLDQCSLLY